MLRLEYQLDLIQVLENWTVSNLPITLAAGVTKQHGLWEIDNEWHLLATFALKYQK